MGYVVGVAARVRWLMCKRGLRAKVNSIGILEEILVVSQTVTWVAHYFSNSLQKLTGNEYCSKLKKEFRFQVI